MGCSSEAKEKDVIRISLTEIQKGVLGPCIPNPGWICQGKSIVSPSHTYPLFEYMKNTKCTMFVALTAKDLALNVSNQSNSQSSQIHFYKCIF